MEKPRNDTGYVSLDNEGVASGTVNEDGNDLHSEVSIELRTFAKKVLFIAKIMVILIILASIGFIVFKLATRSGFEPEQMDLQGFFEPQETDLQGFADLKSYMNQSYDPCEDFYMYSCAGWIEKHKPDYDAENGTDVFSELEKENTIGIRDILESSVKSDASDAENKTRDFYKSCIIIANQNQTGLEYGSRITPDECVNKTKFFFLPVVTRLFVEKFYRPKERQVRKLVKEIRSQFNYQISKTTWLDARAKKLVNLRLNQVASRMTLGYTQSTMDESSQDVQYRELKINSSDYGINLKNLNDLQLINYNCSKPEQYLLDVNPAQHCISDEIIISAAIAQKPFFDRTYPKLLNFARIGQVVGHEFTQAIYKYIIDNWEDNFNATKFCIVKKYDQFVDGHITFNENLADIAGFQVAFKAYMKNKRKEFEIVPGLEKLSRKQLFFVAAAQTKCQGFYDKMAEASFIFNQILKDQRSPNQFRVWGVMSNLKEFAEEFNCYEGSRYNLKDDKCPLFN